MNGFRRMCLRFRIAPKLEPAPHGEVAGLIAHMETLLENAGYFHVPDRTPATKRTIAQMLSRPGFTSEEVRTLRGMIRALAEERSEERPDAHRGRKRA
jgi:tRNA/rRNA methyltransferase